MGFAAMGGSLPNSQKNMLPETFPLTTNKVNEAFCFLLLLLRDGDNNRPTLQGRFNSVPLW